MQPAGLFGNNFVYQGIKYSIPHRVFPGKLSVCRTIGDIEAKRAKYGGNPNVVIGEPEITQFQVSLEYDFLFLASDGIYDRLSNEDIGQSIWETQKEGGIHTFAGKSLENVFYDAFEHKTLDNITAVIICFKALKKKFFPSQSKKVSVHSKVEDYYVPIKKNMGT